MKNIRYFVAGLVAVLALCGCKKEIVSKPHQLSRPLVCLKTKWEEVKIEKTFPGEVVAKTEARVRPQVTGIILDREFEGGEKVKTGQLLFKVDDKTYKANLDLARANLAVEEAKLVNLWNQEKRYKMLLEKNASSKESYENLKSQREQSEAIMEKLKAEVRLPR